MKSLIFESFLIEALTDGRQFYWFQVKNDVSYGLDLKVVGSNPCWAFL